VSSTMGPGVLVDSATLVEPAEAEA